MKLIQSPGSLYFYIIAILFVTIGYGCQSEGHDRGGTGWIDRLNNSTDWATYRGDKSATHYSALNQITNENVDQLELAWTYEARSLSGPGMQSNPIVIDGLMYFADNDLNLIALNAATGEEIWVFNAAEVYGDDYPVSGQLLKGVVYWEDENGENERIFHFTRDLIWAVHPKTGEVIESFGENGYIDQKYNHVWDYEDLDGQIEVTTPGVTYGNYLVVGSKVGEGNTIAPGNIRAWDTITGEYQWTFHTVPLEGQYGYDTWEWEDGMIYGGANPWGGLSVDEERGWVFAATGSAAGEFFYGGSRKGENLFANSVLALDATTGERIWHYQVLCHDIWDYDLPPAPVLATVTHEDGSERDVVVQTGKHPTMDILDRDTGEPLFPVVNKSVPTDGAPGEQPCETQKWPLMPEPLVRTSMYESDITQITPESFEYVKNEMKNFRTGPTYTPPSIEGTVTVPGIHGATEWGGGAYDPENNMYYINVNNIPFVLTLVPIQPDGFEELTPISRGKQTFNSYCAQCHGASREGNHGIPALDNLQKTEDEIKSIINSGVGAMPAFAGITGQELDNLVEYLQSGEEAVSSEVTEIVEGEGEPTWSGGSGDHTWSTTTPQYINRLRHFTDQYGLPAIAPPWGELVAVDIEKAEIAWKVPLGRYEILDSLGIEQNTGAENFGGPAVTSGGVVFIAATEDAMFRAFDAKTGDLLWNFKMETSGHSAPATYEIDGKQYIVQVAGGGGRRYRSPISPGIGRTVYAFTLPDE
ncbi:MAG: c-type cytochrome [Balneolaceae bacterium]